jgi:hypothetical protein
MRPAGNLGCRPPVVDRRNGTRGTVTPFSFQSLASAETQLAVDVQRALTETGYLPLRNVRCSLEGSTVILWGRVPTYYLKQIAQSAAARTAGIGNVNNQIDVGCAAVGDYAAPPSITTSLRHSAPERRRLP